MLRKQFTDLQNACAFAEAIVNTVREPLVVLDQDLRVVAASRSFYRTFKVSPKDTEGKLLYEVERRRVGYCKASRAAGKNLAGGRRDRGL